mmetsp:Transcript_4952/g.9139  ORF Transcript_4952/g.9139 Transcript_4952/m.9139 type:complete len:238 (-) Transcript_4952:111-824(-)
MTPRQRMSRTCQACSRYMWSILWCCSPSLQHTLNMCWKKWRMSRNCSDLQHTLCMRARLLSSKNQARTQDMCRRRWRRSRCCSYLPHNSCTKSGQSKKRTFQVHSSYMCYWTSLQQSSSSFLLHTKDMWRKRWRMWRSCSYLLHNSCRKPMHDTSIFQAHRLCIRCRKLLLKSRALFLPHNSCRDWNLLSRCRTLVGTLRTYQVERTCTICRYHNNDQSQLLYFLDMPPKPARLTSS